MKKILFSALLVFAASDTAAFGQTGKRAAQSVGPAPACSPAETKAPEPSPEARREMEAKLSEARARYARNPNSADAVIWLGRRTAYLGRFDEAIRIFSEGIRRHPRDARLYRHRGHRYITVRCFDAAVEDLERAARLIKGRRDETEPDGLPNARNTPVGTLHSNVWYHLGLAHYLKGDFKKALRAYRAGMRVSTNPDRLVSQGHWLYMTLRRAGRHAEAARVLAPVREKMDVIENGDYHRLMLMYKGRLTPEALLEEASKTEGSLGFATTAYGVGNWYLYTGRPEKALQVFLKIVEGPQVTSFGYIAAEAELNRTGLKNYPRTKLPVRTID